MPEALSEPACAATHFDVCHRPGPRAEFQTTAGGQHEDGERRQNIAVRHGADAARPCESAGRHQRDRRRAAEVGGRRTSETSAPAPLFGGTVGAAWPRSSPRACCGRRCSGRSASVTARYPRGRARRLHGSTCPSRGPAKCAGWPRTSTRWRTRCRRRSARFGEFLANVSHELKTPLTSIRGFSQAMLDGTLDTPEERARAARVIDAESRRVLHLVEELLDLSRIESGQQTMSIWRRCAVDELLAQCATCSRCALREPASRSTSGDDGHARRRRTSTVSSRCWATSSTMRFRHTPRGGPIEIGASAGANGWSSSYVRDTGRGIASEDLPHVFERFYRSKDEASGTGTGLGLAISREIVRAHGGEIHADRRPARGPRSPSRSRRPRARARSQ